MEDIFHWRLEGGSRFRFIVAAVLVVSMCLLTACTSLSLGGLVKSTGEAIGVVPGAVGFVATMKRSSSASDDPVLAFLAEAEDGEVRDLEDAEAGTRLRVTAGRIYQAASGRVCRRFIAVGAAAEATPGEALVCKDATGQWSRVDILVPVSP